MVKGKITIDGKEYFYTYKNFVLIVENYHAILSDDSNNKFTFNTKLGATIVNSKYNCITFFIAGAISSGTSGLVIETFAYIETYSKDMTFNRVTFESKELNWFYNVRNSYEYHHKLPTGETSIEFHDFNKTSREYSFNLQGVNVQLNLNIKRTVKNMDTNPIELATQMSFTSDNTNDYNLAFKLNGIAKNILWFVTYRKNIHFEHIYIKSKKNNDKYDVIGEMHLNHVDTDYYIEDVKYIKERLIPFEKLEPVFDNFLKYITSDNVYTHHIPYNSRNVLKLTPARFILIIAAFEWDFDLFYGDVKYKTNQKYREAKDDIIRTIETLKEKNTGDKKRYIKNFLKLYKSSKVRLSERLLHSYSDNHNVLDKFMTKIYKECDVEEYKISKIAQRLEKQRNNYAHGNIGKDFDEQVIPDLMTVEWMLYSIKLSSFGLDSNEVKQIINRLFKHNLYFE